MTKYSNLQQLPIALLSNWSQTRPSNPKYPKYSVKDPTSKLTLEQAIKEVELSDALINLGFIASANNPYIIIDIDDSTTLPECFKPFISIESTYTEYSYSGTGLHIILELSEEAYIYFKQNLKLKIVKAGKDNNNWEGQYSFSNNFMVMTGDKLPSSPLSIATISLETMKNLLQATASKRHTEIQRKIDKPSTYVEFPSFLTFGEMKRVVLGIPLDQRFTVKEAYEKLTGETYSHYELWLKVGMAIHYESSLLQKLDKGYKLFLDWSKTDPTAYTGEEAVHDKWLSFSSDNMADNKITGDTLRALNVNTVYKWPDTIKGKPDPRSMKNVQYAFNNLDLQFYSLPGTGLFVKGSDCLINNYFNKAKDFFGYKGPIPSTTLDLSIIDLFQQEFNWKGLSWSPQVERVLHSIVPQLISPIHAWLSTPLEKFPHEWQKQDNMLSNRAVKNSNLETLLDCFKFPKGVNSDLCRLKITKFLMHIIKMSRHELLEEPNEGILILSGPENTRKTSFFRELLPKFLSFCTSTWFEAFQSDKQRRDFNRLLASRALIYLDECDTMFKPAQIATEFKKILTSTTVEYTEIYAKEPIQVPRLAAIAGTTNESKIQMSNTGSRRIWFVPIEFIEMEKLNNISRYYLFKDIERIFDEELQKGNKPWIMTPEESQEVVIANEPHAARSNLREVFQEIFPIRTTRPMTNEELISITQAPQKARVDHPHCFTRSRIEGLIAARFPQYRNVSIAELKNVAREHSLQYTKRHDSIFLPNKYLYKNGTLTRADRLYYVLPKVADDDSFDEVAEQDSENLE